MEVTSEVRRRGYSIRTLMVIMSLIAVWLVLPRHFSQLTFRGMSPVRFSICCTLMHQAALWILVGTLVWLLADRRRVVLYVAVVPVVAFWGPILLAMLEGNLSASGDYPMVRSALMTIGLYEGYVDFYDQIYGWFGYEPV